MRTNLLLSCCYLLLTATSLLAQSNTKPVIDHPATVIASLQKDIPVWMKQSNVPGMTIAYIHKGKLAWTQQFGVLNSDTKQPVTGATVFEAASLTKVITAYAALKLVDEGRLNLDTPLNKYLGNNYDVVNDTRINLITARRVLSHTSGFPNWRAEGATSLPVNFTPGEKYSYSGEGFVYLAKVVAHITNMKFEDYVKQVVFEPLQMKQSNLFWKDGYDSVHIYRHDWFGMHPFQAKYKEVNAAASLRTTAADYAKFIIALLNGTGLKKATWQQMITPQIQVDEKHPDVAWGLGVGLESTPAGTCFWHWGDQGNAKCYMVANVKQKEAVVYFTNAKNGLAFAREVTQESIGGNHPGLDWLNYDRYNPAFSDLLQQAIDKGAPVALQQFKQDRQNNKIALTESNINSIGYLLLQLKKVDDAIAVFEQNTTDYPNSANAWDSQAEGYMIKGNKELAIKYYEKSLQLNPDNTNAAEQLTKLKQ